MSLLRLVLSIAVSCALVALLTAATAVSAAEVRTWTDVAGRKTEAKFVRIFNGEVILEKDGRMLKVPLARFSAADQKHIRELTDSPTSSVAAQTKADGAPRRVESTATTPAAAKGDKPAADAAKEPDAKAAAVELQRMRDWRDNAGNVIKARFERLFGQQVVLTAGNRLRTVDFSRLSAADQEFLRKNLEAQGRAAEVPAAVAQSPAASASADATQSAASPNIGGAPSIPGSNLPNFGDLASRMRQHQDQIRATQEQLRSQVQQMHQDMRTARDRIPRPAPAPAPFSTPIVEAGTSPAAASDSVVSTGAPPAVPDLSRPSPTPPTVAGGPVHDPFASPAARRPERAIPQSPFERNQISPTPGTQPEDPFAGAPLIEPQYQEIVICGACNKAQKPGFKAGQRCQHCGKTIDEIEDESGNVVERSSNSTRRNIKFWVWAVIAGISVIGGIIAKLKG